MKAILIPVKEFRAAKQRLAAHYSEKAREELARALCRDFFAMIAGISGVPVFVVSKDTEVLSMAQARGWETIVEENQVSESRSVDFASHLLAGQGISALLRIPVDMPLAKVSDVTDLLDSAGSPPCCIIVPSGEGTGTNALLRSPPNLFPSHFGPGSFAKHVAEANAKGASLRVIENPRLALDIDELDDLKKLAGRQVGTATTQWLSERGLVPPGE